MGQNLMAVILQVRNISKLELAISYVISKSKLAPHKKGLLQQILIFFNEQAPCHLYYMKL